MDETSRFFIAYAIIGVIAVVGVPAMLIYARKRRREMLRRRGVKRYGH